MAAISRMVFVSSGSENLTSMPSGGFSAAAVAGGGEAAPSFFSAGISATGCAAAAGDFSGLLPAGSLAVFAAGLAGPRSPNSWIGCLPVGFAAGFAGFAVAGVAAGSGPVVSPKIAAAVLASGLARGRLLFRRRVWPARPWAAASRSRPRGARWAWDAKSSRRTPSRPKRFPRCTCQVRRPT